MKFSVIYFSLVIQIYAQTIQIYVDKNFVQEGEFISLTIEADGANDFPLADLNPLDSDFEIISGPSQQTNFQWINGKMKNTKTLKWTLLPKKTGDIIIPPIVLTLGNKSFTGKPISINVSASKGNSGNSPSLEDHIALLSCFVPPRVGKSCTWPLQASTIQPFPRYFLIVRAFAPDSKIMNFN